MSDDMAICNSCNTECAANMAPMLHDDVWLQLAEEDEMLCDSCFRKRTVEWNVEITLASLKPCSFNLLFGGSEPYFNEYAKHEKEIPFHREWMSIAQRLLLREAKRRKERAGNTNLSKPGGLN